MRRLERFNLGVLAVVAFAAAPLAAWEETLTRDGAYWVQKVSGTESAAAAGRLRVSTRGHIVVNGGGDEQVRYVFTKRVKARSADEARRLLGQFVVKSHRQGDLSVVHVAHSGPSGSLDMQVTAPRTLRDVLVETYGGAVDANDLQGSLQAYTGGGRIRLDRIGGQVVAKTAGGEIVLGSIGGSVRCVSAGGPIRADAIKGEARFETAGGDIVVKEVEGPLYASTAGGSVTIGRAGSSVGASTVGGVIQVGSARGMVTAESQGGPIVVGAASSVKCETGGGAIKLSNVSGTLHATTMVGNIFAQLLSGVISGDSFLSTGAGDITVFVPSNLAVTIQAKNESGYNQRIVSDFPDVMVRREGPVVTAEGQLNGGGPLLRLASAGGTIYIRRK